MKRIILLFIPFFFSSCIVVIGNSEQKAREKQTQTLSFYHKKIQVNSFLNQWHKDVANSDFDAYFGKMSETAVFIGTDASENWTVQQFKDFAKPHFYNKKTWDFKALERNVYFNSKGDIAWFDELLDTWMGICRGSGVLLCKNGNWEIEQYVLSIVIPNEFTNQVIEIKKEKDTQIIQQIKPDQQ
ncbi:MAG: nuclear transport factor 2 family protein [Flavobacteriaceae bacterium]|nr:nuclear transport factor 2 family protein [Flavobacteriaceae bacterium]